MAREQKSLKIHRLDAVVVYLCLPNFVYLGSVIDKEGGTDTDIKARLQKARRAFGMLSRVWSSRAYNTNTKLRIFNTNVKPVLL